MDKNIIRIITENKAGILYALSKLLAKEGINVEDIVATTFGDKAMIMLMSSDQKKALSVIQNNGYHVLEEESVIIKLKNQPGALAEVTKLLAKTNINIMSAVIINKDTHHAFFVMVVDNPVKTQEVLSAYIV